MYTDNLLIDEINRDLSQLYEKVRFNSMFGEELQQGVKLLIDYLNQNTNPIDPFQVGYGNYFVEKGKRKLFKKICKNILIFLQGNTRSTWEYDYILKEISVFINLLDNLLTDY